MIPRLVIAGTRSGVGKTVVTLGLAAALRDAGFEVSLHKVGPDFIDPSHHQTACARPPRNLDPLLQGTERIVPLFLHGAAGADIALIEGVMGLFDGSGPDAAGSTAEVAQLLRAPIVLVVDASASATSIAAEVWGFHHFDPEVSIAGVIANRVGSARHAELIRAALDRIDVRLLAALPRDGGLELPSRHLGLVPAAERERRDVIARAAAVVRTHVDLAEVVGIARRAEPLSRPAWDPTEEVAPITAPRPLPVGILSGPAFSFRYTEHVELLRAAGGDPIDIDPLLDTELPEGCGALYLPGGFPELYVDELAANTPLRAAIRRFDGPLVAECGGLLYLCRTLDRQPMCGVVPADAQMTDTLRLAYRRATLAADSPLGPAGTSLVAHEFHRTAVTPPCGDPPAVYLEDGTPEGFGGPRLHASYLHPHWVAAPHIATRLLEGASRARR